MATKSTSTLRPLTRRQREVLRLIRQHIDRLGYPPSLRELAGELGINPTGVAGHLASLERKGAIRRSAGVARAIMLIGGRNGR